MAACRAHNRPGLYPCGVPHPDRARHATGPVRPADSKWGSCFVLFVFVEEFGVVVNGLVFVDVETTSLDPDTGEIWEVGAVVRLPDGADVERQWMLQVTLDHADPVSLDIGGFQARHPGNDAAVAPAEFAAEFAVWTAGVHLVGNVVSFDAERLRRLLTRHGLAPKWHYHLVDCEALVAGRLRIPPPWRSVELSEAVGVDLPVVAHTALGDARWARDLYDAVMNTDTVDDQTVEA